MKKLCLVFMLLIAIGGACFAQTPVEENKFVGAGLALFQSARPQIQGFGFLALPISGRVFSYTDYDVAALPGEKIEGQAITFPKIQYSMRTGAAVRVYNVSKRVTLYGLGGAGIAADGNAVVGSFSGGGFIDIVLGKGWGALVVLQVDRNSETGTQFIPRLGVRKNIGK